MVSLMSLMQYRAAVGLHNIDLKAKEYSSALKSCKREKVHAIIYVLPGGSVSFNFKKSYSPVANELLCKVLVQSNVCVSFLHSFNDSTS